MDNQKLESYTTDLYALVNHTLTVVRNQKSSDKVTHPKAIDLLHDLDLALNNQVREFNELDGSLEESAEKTIKEKLASAAGKVAGYIDTARGDAASKMLRDDYTALSMIASGYTMLHTAALGAGNDELAEFTKESLTRIAQLITDTSIVIPHVVAEELEISDIANEAENNTQQAWDPENFMA